MSDDKKGAAAASASNAAGSKDGQDKDKKSDTVAVDDALERSHYEMELTVVHPLVLLSVVDHYTRVAKDTAKVGPHAHARLLSRNTSGQSDDYRGSFLVPVCNAVIWR